MQQEGRAQCTAGEQFAIDSVMPQFDGFGVRYERNRMVSHDIARADGMDTYGAGRALTGMAMAAINHNIREVLAAGIGHGFAKLQGCSGRGIKLVAMVRLDNLDIPAGAKVRGSLPRELSENIYTNT